MLPSALSSQLRKLLTKAQAFKAPAPSFLNQALFTVLPQTTMTAITNSEPEMQIKLQFRGRVDAATAIPDPETQVKLLNRGRANAAIAILHKTIIVLTALVILKAPIEVLAAIAICSTLVALGIAAPHHGVFANSHGTFHDL